MAAGDLVTLAQALAWLNLTVDPNGFVAGMVSAVSTQIQNYVGYQFAASTYTRTFNGIGSDRMLLPDRPVVAVTAVTIDGFTVPQSTGPLVQGFVNDNKFVYLQSGNGCGGFWFCRFLRGIQNITVIYSAGYATIPADVIQACLEFLKTAYAQTATSADPTIKAYRAGDTQVDYQNLVTKLQGSTLLLPPLIAAALQPYIRVAS